MVAQLHTAHIAAGHGLQHRIAERHILHAAALAGNAVYPLFVVELPHQLDHKVAFFCKRPVRAFQHIAAKFAARLLQSRNGACRCQAAGGSALAHIPVAADFLQLAHPCIPVADAVAAQYIGLQRPETVVRQPAHHVHDVLAKVGQLFFVHTRCVAQHITGLCSQFHVFVHGVVHLVNGGLGVLHHINVSKARRAVLFPEQRVKHKGVFSVVIKATLGILRVVLAGIQHHAVAVFAVMQHRLPALKGLFVIPVHHNAFVAGVNAVVVDVLCHIHASARVPGHLRVSPFQLVIVHKAQAEQVRRVLNIFHARLPVQHQQVHAPDADLAKPAARLRVPEHALHAGAGLQLAPPCVAVHGLVVALLQHRGQDLGKRFCCFLVVLCPRQHVRFRVVVHGIGVLVGNAVEQPSAGRLGLALHFLVFVIFPVPHAKPQFVIHNALVKGCFSGLVFLQNVVCLADVLFPDHLLCGQFRLCRQAVFPHQWCFIEVVDKLFKFSSVHVPAPFS